MDEHREEKEREAAMRPDYYDVRDDVVRRSVLRCLSSAVCPPLSVLRCLMCVFLFVCAYVRVHVREGYAGR